MGSITTKLRPPISSHVTFYLQQKLLHSVAFVFSKPKHRVPVVVALSPSPSCDPEGGHGPGEQRISTCGPLPRLYLPPS